MIKIAWLIVALALAAMLWMAVSNGRIPPHSEQNLRIIG